MCWLSVDQVKENWENISSRISHDPTFLRYFSVQSLVDDILALRVQVWTAGSDLVIFTRIDTYPSNIKTLRVLWALGTGLDLVLPTIVDVFRRFAAKNGCQDVEITGRLGWVPKMKKYVPVKIVQTVITIPVDVVGREQ